MYSASLKTELVVTNMNGLLGVLPTHLAMLGITDANTASDLQVMSNEATPTTQLPLLEPLAEPYSERQLAASGTDLDLDLSVVTGCQTLKQDLQQQHESYVAVKRSSWNNLSQKSMQVILASGLL